MGAWGWQGRRWVWAALAALALVGRPAAAAEKSPADGAVDRGVELLEKGQRGKAGQAFGEGIRLDPQAAGPHLGLGQVFERQEKMAEAAREYGQAAKLAPGEFEPHLMLGYALMDLDQLDDACRELEAA